VARLGTYLGLAVVGAVALWLLAIPFFGGHSDRAMNGAVQVLRTSAEDTNGAIRVRVAAQVLKARALEGMTIADIGHAVCRLIEARGELSDVTYRVDVILENAGTSTGKRLMPFSVPVDAGQCAEPQAEPDTRIVYPGRLAGWKLQTGGQLTSGLKGAMRFVHFAPRDGADYVWPFPFDLACDFVVKDRVARQYLHSLKMQFPDVGSTARFAITAQVGPLAEQDIPAFRTFTLGERGCNEVRA